MFREARLVSFIYILLETEKPEVRARRGAQEGRWCRFFGFFVKISPTFVIGNISAIGSDVICLHCH